MPDSIYQVTVSVTGSGSKGFEVSPQILGTQLGTLIAGSNNHLTGGTKYGYAECQDQFLPGYLDYFSGKAPAAGTGMYFLCCLYYLQAGY